MKVKALIAQLQQAHPDMEVCIHLPGDDHCLLDYDVRRVDHFGADPDEGHVTVWAKWPSKRSLVTWALSEARVLRKTLDQLQKKPDRSHGSEKLREILLQTLVDIAMHPALHEKERADASTRD